MRRQIIALFSLAVLAGCAHTQQRSEFDVWLPPQTQPQVAQLPHLTGDLKLDGKLDELAGGAATPIHMKSQIVQQTPTHHWKGEADLSADFLTAWTDRGLVIGGSITDDDIINTKTGMDSWQQDCIELFVDGRGKGFMSRDFGPDAYQFFVRPPVEGKPVEAIVCRGQQIPVQVAGQLRQGGWTFELLIPWSAFSQRPKMVGLAYQVDESDTYDNGQRGATFAVPARDDLWKNPSVFVPYQLALMPKAGGHAGTAMIVDAPGVIAQQAPEKIRVLVAGDLAAKASKVRLSAAPGHIPNKAIWQLTSPAIEVRQRDGVATAAVDFPMATFPKSVSWPMGYCMLKAEVLDDKGQSLGYVQQPVLNVGDSVERYTRNIENARIGTMAATDPYRAAEWCGAAAAVDRLKQAAAGGQAMNVGWRLLEADARITLAQGNQSPKLARQYLHDLLVLQSDPQAEVAVEFPDAHKATVTFNWGAIPLGSVVVTQTTSAEAAQREVMQSFVGVPSWPTKLFRAQTNLESNVFILSAPVTPQEVNLYQEVFAWFAQQNTLCAVSIDKLDLLNCQAVVLLPGAGLHAETAKAIAMAQDQRSVPRLPIAEAAKLDCVLVGGDPAGEKLLASAKLTRITPRKGATVIVLAQGDRVMRATAPDEASCYSMLQYAMGNGPVSRSQVDALRKRILKAIAPDVKPGNSKQRIAQSLYCGDLHMHSFYSDGNCSPSALMLEAIYAQQDFSVMTDHNTIAGALRAKELLAQAGIRYDQIVGEEFTTKYHANIFPVDQAYQPPMEAKDLTRLMHEKNIYVQWNHPGFPEEWGHEYIVNGMNGLGFDAWEHLPQRYDLWRAKGELPLITGTTDTHDGTFGEWPERTIIFSAKADGQSLANALRAGQAVAVIQEAGTLFVGAPEKVQLATAALAEGEALRKAHEQRLRETLKGCRPAEMIKAGETTAVAPEPK